ncbi:MAG: S1/P1 Nuclease [Bacteroidetes bacterium B1(2017)]|nr:MAG: S1/P1 Nuclease [Bacteroidetes bacterium B1(2017)]
MKYPCLKLGFVFFLLFMPNQGLFAWGFYAHQQINRLAVFCLPTELFGFYKKNIDYISEHAVDPDKRRYLVAGEGVKHFIDMDYYEKVLPFDTLPRAYHLACEKFSKDTLHTYGIVSWNIQWMLRNLTEAFAQHNTSQILKYSAEIGHYIADSHVPLHATSNYNGQQTNQHGIHAFFETRLPELFAPKYDFFVGPASYISSPLEASWLAVEGSFACLDSVFGFEKKLHQHFPEHKKYTYEVKGNALLKMYSPELAWAYHQQLNGMVERRMQAAIRAVSSFWYTAWVNAGQPNMDNLNLIPTDTINLEAFPVALPEKMLGRQE